MGNFTELLRAHQFQAGLVDGVLALAVVLLCRALRVFGRRPPLVGGAFALAALAALTGTGPGRRALEGVGGAAVWAVLLLLAGGVVSRVLPPAVRLVVGPWLLVPGSIALGLAAHAAHHGVPWWAVWVLIIAVPPCGILAGDFDRYHAEHALGPLLLVIAVGGLYVTVPDTEGARALLGVALPFLLVTFPLPLARLGAGGAAAAVGLFAYDAVLEGISRPASFVGALGCLGLLVCEPIGRRVFARRGRWPGAPSDHVRVVVVAAVLQGALVVWTSHVSGRVHGALTAALLLIPAAVIGAICAPMLPPPQPDPPVVP